jgi:hypothetical protein
MRKRTTSAAAEAVGEKAPTATAVAGMMTLTTTAGTVKEKLLCGCGCCCCGDGGGGDEIFPTETMGPQHWLLQREIL